MICLCAQVPLPGKAHKPGEQNAGDKVCQVLHKQGDADVIIIRENEEVLTLKIEKQNTVL